MENLCLDVDNYNIMSSVCLTVSCTDILIIMYDKFSKILA